MLLEEFDTGQNLLNLTAAAQMAAICCHVYEDEQEECAAFIGPESRILNWTHHEGTWVPSFCVIQSGPHRYYVVIEGTVSFTQALIQACPMNTLRQPETDDPDHAAYYGLFYYQVYEQLFDRVKDLIPFSDPLTRVFFSGHSMGGAVAQVGAFRFAGFQAEERVQCLTIGQPRAMGVGSVSIPQPGVYWRVVSEGDVVPGYPFAPATLVISKIAKFTHFVVEKIDWAHYGQEWVLYANGTLDGQGPPAYPLARGITINAVNEHYLENYLGRILKAAQVQEPD